MSLQNNDTDLSSISYKEDTQKLFAESARALTKLFNKSNHAYDEGYAQGRQDAYEEVFKWFTYQHDNSLRHVSVVSFFNFINDKLNSTNSKFAQSKYFQKFLTYL